MLLTINNYLKSLALLTVFFCESLSLRLSFSLVEAEIIIEVILPKRYQKDKISLSPLEHFLLPS